MCQPTRLNGSKLNMQLNDISDWLSSNYVTRKGSLPFKLNDNDSDGKRSVCLKKDALLPHYLNYLSLFTLCKIYFCLCL